MLTFISIMMIPYALMVVGTAFFVKRGLMLGGHGSSVYYGGAISGSGSYEEEARILKSMGVRASEFPFDIVIALLGLAPSVYVQFILTPANTPPAYAQFVLAPADAPNEFLFVFYGILLVFMIALTVIVMWRRKKLGRR